MTDKCVGARLRKRALHNPERLLCSLAGLKPSRCRGGSELALEFVVPETIMSSAPTQFRFAQVGETKTLTGSYDFTTNTFLTNTPNSLKFAGTSPGDFTGGLYAQAFMWTEAGADLTFNNITLTVNGNVVPEPSSILLLAAGVLSIVFVLRKH